MVLIACRCDAPGENLDGEGSQRTQEHTEALMDAFDEKTLWFDYGIVSNIMVCQQYEVSQS